MALAGGTCDAGDLRAQRGQQGSQPPGDGTEPPNGDLGAVERVELFGAGVGLLGVVWLVPGSGFLRFQEDIQTPHGSQDQRQRMFSDRAVVE
ncbi:hypothetical protein PJL18_04419 [Paenarthrobacter nicotinovorans]|nr:hypothetical protein [Paenarthrobacter nicotinovorans]